ncbi:competence/damage-inducible protein A [Halosimplex aquaticum]|uniref:Competence/damage-inducible protein A n=1 Tax=Halosimplex aquaticum TaxID=3026162 RepID=A0ABD5Y3L7_9EURY|nr:competence/damage-inducible protein A [Halosimplex aquaticum]
MDVAIVTVGDELLAGDTENTNATWLARQLAERGATVTRMLTIPDDRALIARWVGEFADAFDAVIVTGGLGDTPDDVTVAAVADAFDRDLEVQPDVRERIAEKARQFREADPEYYEQHDFDLDLDETAALPAGARPIQTEESFNPGCVVENVYVFPGFPGELKVMFDSVADEFGGDAVSDAVETATPEGALKDVLDGARERFDVAVGSYPARRGEPGRVKVTGTDPAEVERAIEWVDERVADPE